MLRCASLLLALTLAACAAQDAPPDQAIVVVFGFELSADREVENLSLIVMLPPDVPGVQTIRAERFSPEPVRIFERDGNRYAEFLFRDPAPKTTVRVEVDADVRRRDLARLRAGFPRTGLSAQERARYLAVEASLEHDHPLVRALVARLAGEDEFERIESGFDLVADTLTYPGYVKDDQGVAETCRRRSGDCTDYSDLLVALCRADGVPARAPLGILKDRGVTEPHSWVEVWTDEHGWITVDPLLGDLGKVEFDRLRSTYFFVTTERNETVLAPWHFYRYDYEGAGDAKVKPTYTLEALR